MAASRDSSDKAGNGKYSKYELNPPQFTNPNAIYEPDFELNSFQNNRTVSQTQLAHRSNTSIATPAQVYTNTVGIQDENSILKRMKSEADNIANVSNKCLLID